MDLFADRYKKIISTALLGALAGLSLYSQSLAEPNPALPASEQELSATPSSISSSLANQETLEPSWQIQMLHPQSWLATHGDLVYAGSEFGRKIYAYNAEDGQGAWERNTQAPAWSRPVIHGTNIAYCTADNMFTIRNAGTGRWGGRVMLHSGLPTKDGRMRAPSQCKATPMPYKDFFLIISVSGSLTLLNSQAKIEKRAGLQMSSLKRTIFWADMTDCGDYMLAPSLNGSIWKIEPDHLWSSKEYIPQFKNLPPNGSASSEFRTGGVLADNIYIL
ncbi:MAG: PQQ-like beta-propeller repeat protein, partial [bacterium]|nr:PQQ-like beta-propeller repeat protein [bacterium]